MLSGDEVGRPLLEQPMGDRQPELACCAHRVCTTGSIRSIAAAVPTNILPVQTLRDVEADPATAVGRVDDRPDADLIAVHDRMSGHRRLASGVESFQNPALDSDGQPSVVVVEFGERGEELSRSIGPGLDRERTLTRCGRPFGQPQLLTAKRRVGAEARKAGGSEDDGVQLTRRDPLQTRVDVAADVDDLRVRSPAVHLRDAAR